MTNQILALPNECWGWFPGYVNLYQVSTRGQVRGVGRWITAKDGKKYFREGRILKPKRLPNGYLQVQLCRNGKKRWFQIHRLVAETWIDNPENKPQVNHRDENKTNNDVYNLEWCDRKYNVNYGTCLERRAASQSKPVQAINPNTGEVVLEFPSTADAGRKGFSAGDISECCLGKRKTHRGYIWRFKP